MSKKNRFYITAKLPAHIKAIHIEYSDEQIQTFNFENKPKNKESRVLTNLILDSNPVDTNILFTPVTHTLRITENERTEQPN